MTRKLLRLAKIKYGEKMKRDEFVNYYLQELVQALQVIEPEERVWAIDQLSRYFCTECGDNVDNCSHDNDN